jgi:hypothetical protein
VSILSVMPAEWCEPADLIDGEEDVPVYPADAFSFTATGGWWSAGPDLTEDE